MPVRLEAPCRSENEPPLTAIAISLIVEAIAAGYTKVADVAVVSTVPANPDYAGIAYAASQADLAVMCVSVPSSEVR